MLFSLNVIRIYDKVPEHVLHLHTVPEKMHTNIHRLRMVDPFSPYFSWRIMILPWNRSLTEQNGEHITYTKRKIVGKCPSYVFVVVVLLLCV